MHISNIDVWGLLTKPVGPYVDPSIKFCLPVFTNFSSCLFAIVNRNYDELPHMEKISRGFDFMVGQNFRFGIYSISQLKVWGRFKKI